MRRAAMLTATFALAVSAALVPSAASAAPSQSAVVAGSCSWC